MKNELLRTWTTLFLVVLIALSYTVPVYADYSSWFQGVYATPPKYGNRSYTRTQWMRFYTNYYDTDQPRTGTYATPVGAYYGLVFDDLGSPNPNTGWTTIEKSPKYPPASSAAMNGDVSNWLTGYLGLNSNLHDNNYWLASPAYLAGLTQPVSIGGTNYFVQSSWPLSQHAEGSNQKQDVPIYVGTSLSNGSQPHVTPGTFTVSNPLCIRNGPDVFQAGANDGTKTRYVWSGLASSEAAGGQPPIGDVNLTRTAAGNVVGSVFNKSNPTGQYMTSGYVTASFPYNIMVAGVARQAGSGSIAYYNWSVINQTPLWLKNITVRVYTRGESTNTWYLAAVYRNIDMPPATTDGLSLKYGSSTSGSYMTSSGSVSVTPAGVWSVAQPLVNTSVPVPAEAYDVVVTANVNLNVSGGRLGTPSPDAGMTAIYWNGAVPPGLPAHETKEFSGLSGKAQQILGISLPSGYNDNVGSANNNAGADDNPPPQSGHNLVAASLSQATSNSLSFTFTGNMPVAGTAHVRFYIQSMGGRLTGYGGVRQVHINANSGATVTTTAVPFSPGSVVFASVDADSSDGKAWIAAPTQGFPGDDGRSYPETTYLDNYTVVIIEGNAPPGGYTPAPQEETHPTTYPIMKNAITMQDNQVPVMGWKRVPYTEEQFTGRIRTRLVPPPPGWDEYGNHVGQ
jgi:hypothetical protein